MKTKGKSTILLPQRKPGAGCKFISGLLVQEVILANTEAPKVLV